MNQSKDLLIEIQTEELPPKSLLKLAQSFAKDIDERLRKANFSFQNTVFFATPRRLAVIVHALIEQQPDVIVEKRGPALNAAFDVNGEPTKACAGFAKSANVAVSDLITIKTEQGEWVGVQQTIAGKTVAELIPAIIEQALQAMPIAKRMRWGSHEIAFVRPVHHVILLYGNEVIDASILNVKAGRNTCGHRFLANKQIEISAANTYQKQLRDVFVIADFAERQKKIKDAIAQLQLPENMRVVIDDALLEEVTNLVEWPVPLLGTIDSHFLTLPKEILISAMQDHQRYFHVTDKQEQLGAYFVTMSNIESKDPARVIHGNERVLRARLSDAQFFYETDKKQTLVSRVEQLKNIVFQAKLGTLFDKTERVRLLAECIAEKMQLNVSEAARASLLCKTDLTTDVVNEFPELQGVMSYYYAKHDGETETIATALRDYYLPRFAGDQLPENKIAEVLAIADRLDTLVGAFGIHQIPTGDKDPYGLRRASIAVLRILIEKKMDLDLFQLLTVAADNYHPALPNKNTTQDILSFMQERLRAWYQEKQVAADVFASVAALNLSNLSDVDKRIKAVQTFKQLSAAEILSAANKRVNNILVKYAEKLDTNDINPDFFENEAEHELARQLEIKSKIVAKLTQTKNYSEVLLELAELRKPVDDFFDHVMVMTDNKQQRENRLLMLTKLRALFLQVADIALLQ